MYNLALFLLFNKIRLKILKVIKIMSRATWASETGRGLLILGLYQYTNFEGEKVEKDKKT